MALCDITNVTSRTLGRSGGLVGVPGTGFQCPSGYGCDPESKAAVAAFAEHQAAKNGRPLALLTPSTTASSGDMEICDSGDPQEVAEYVVDIYEKLKEEEKRFRPQPDYMERQPDINGKMRGILIDWLVEVHMKYKLKMETLFLAVSITDRYLERAHVRRKQLQLVGVTAILIAAKFEEIYAPEVREFVYITDRAYTKEEIHDMELQILTRLEFQLCFPTAAHFFERYQRANQCSEVHCRLIQYILELTLVDIKMIRYPPSHVVAAACMLSNKLLKVKPSWPSAMVNHTQQTEQMVRDCAKDMCGLLENAGHGHLQAVKNKFAQAAFHHVSNITF